MHRDQKVGFALAILLIGIVAALFFRNEPNNDDEAPSLQNPTELDKQIAEKPLVPYLTGDVETLNSSKQVQTKSEDSTARNKPSSHAQLPEFLKQNTAAGNNDVASSAPAPDPINISASKNRDNAAISIPEHNKAWSADANSGRTTNSKSSNSDAQQRFHRVKKGDTLSKLAKRYLGSTARFLEIYEVNRNVLKSPNDLRVGMKIRIPARQAMKKKRRRPFSTASSSATTGTNSAQSKAKQITPAKSQSKLPPNSNTAIPKTKAATSDNSADTKPTGGTQTPTRRFVPARRIPFVPRRQNPGSANTNDRSSKVKTKKLSQVPPTDLPQLDDDKRPEKVSTKARAD